MSDADKNVTLPGKTGNFTLKEEDLIRFDDEDVATRSTAAANTAQSAPSMTKKFSDLRIDTDLGHGRTHAQELAAEPTLKPIPTSGNNELHPDTANKASALSQQSSATSEDLTYNEKEAMSQTVQEQEQSPVKEDNDSSLEIQSIMEQFTGDALAPTKEEIMSPRHEMPNPFLHGSGSYPPRQSSLEHLRPNSVETESTLVDDTAPEKVPLSPPPPGPNKTEFGKFSAPIHAQKAGSTTSLPTQLPEPEPEPELPFDFHRFLEQLRHKSADPVAKYLRSFLAEFGKKQWLVHEQVKLISDFLSFISGKMAQCEIWREVSDNEFDNAKEGMEKLVMNRLYSQTFSPAIPPPPPPPPARSRSRSKRKDLERTLGTGRRGQHQEDVERDEILAQRIRIYGWVKEENLDIPPVGPNGERFLRLAQQELTKIKGYRAPRDKVICILNCCKVIFGLLKNTQSTDTSADSFIPLLIFVVLQANPEHMVSNIQYILRFRNQDKLNGEAGYYLSSLSGAIQFIEGMGRSSLTISDEDFEKHVEIAVSAIAEQHREAEAASPKTHRRERSALSEKDGASRDSIDTTSTSPRKSAMKEPRSSTSTNADGSEDGPAAGLFRTIQRPLSTIGRMFSDQDASDGSHTESSTAPSHPSPSAISPRDDPSPTRVARRSGSSARVVKSFDSQEAAARQASVEAAEARRIQRAEHKTVVDTLCGMFPNLDRDIIDDVVRQKQGRVGSAVDACLALTSSG